MALLCNSVGEFLSVKNFPFPSFVPVSNLSAHECFQILETNLAVSLTTPAIFVTIADDGQISMSQMRCVGKGALSDLLNMSSLMVNGINIHHHLLNLWQNGYTIIKSVVADDIITRARDCVVAQPHRRISNLLAVDTVFHELLTTDLITTIIGLFLSAPNKCATWSSHTLFPGQGNVDWHVDYPYHCMPQPWSIEPASAQVLWMLDDFTVANGATQAIAGSQYFGHYPTPEMMKHYNTTNLEGEKGNVLIAHGAWWHTPGINTTEKSRSCLLATFTQTWIPSKDNMQEQFDQLPQIQQSEKLKLVLGL